MGKKYKDSLKTLEADIQHANTLAVNSVKDDDGSYLQLYVLMGKNTMHVHERKASMRQFYGVVFPSIMQLQSGITDLEERKQKETLVASYSRKDSFEKEKLSDADVEREAECGICMEINSKVVLPNCNHSLCFKCYRDWHARSRSCPFCRESLKGVKLTDLWIYIEEHATVDLAIILKENTKRLFMYIEKLLIVPSS